MFCLLSAFSFSPALCLAISSPLFTFARTTYNVQLYKMQHTNYGKDADEDEDEDENGNDDNTCSFSCFTQEIAMEHQRGRPL